jgi:hypothetical protein
MAVNGNQGGIAMWPSLATASWLYNLANWFLIGALVIGAASTVLIVWMGNVKEGYLSRDLSAMNERAATAEKAAEEAKLALEMYKAPRSISSEQQEVIGAAIKPFGGQTYSLSMATGAEPMNLLVVIDSIFQRAGWVRGGPFGSVLVSTPVGKVGVNAISGVSVRAAPSHEEAYRERIHILAAALSAAGIAAGAAQDPNVETTPTTINVMVGSKPQ